MRAAALLIWDEAPMSHRHTFEALDRTLRDITGLDQPFGGKVLVAGGDFRQILPVVRRAAAPQIVASSLCRCAVAMQRLAPLRCALPLHCPCTLLPIAMRTVLTPTAPLPMRPCAAGQRCGHTSPGCG
jgi:hypothetical protein